MNKIQESRYRQISSVAIAQIIFGHSEWVTLWGTLTEGGIRRKMNFVIDFETLNRWLRFSGKTGDDIQMQLVSRLEEGISEPSVVDLEALYGRALALESCRLTVCHPKNQLKNGEWEEDRDSLFIDEVEPLIAQKRLLRDPKNQCRENLKKCEELLSRSYELYLGYLELEFSEEEALRKAELN